MIDWVDIHEPSSVAEARRRARRLATALDLDSPKSEHAAIVATEAGQNLLRHGGGGRMLIQTFGPPGAERLVIVAVDDGPGIARIDRMLRDGETTKNSSGTGLGAMKRLSDRFDIYSETGAGTIVAAEFLPRTVKHADGEDVAALRLAYPGERVCGDSLAVRPHETLTRLFLCDGLGHGGKAAEAADIARATFLASERRSLDGTLQQISDALAGTRGAVASLVEIDRAAGTLTHAGVGNISTLHINAERAKRLPVRDGSLGSASRTPIVETVDLGPDDIVVMHSDGIRTLRLSERRAPILQRGSLVIAAQLLHANFRGRDDASIIVARMKNALPI